MSVAQQDQVRQIGWASARPEHDVVSRRPRGEPVAPRPLASLVPRLQRLAHRRRDVAPRTTHVDHTRIGIQKNPRDVAVAGQTLHRLPRNRQRVLEIRRGRSRHAAAESRDSWSPAGVAAPRRPYAHQARSTRRPAGDRDFGRRPGRIGVPAARARRAESRRLHRRACPATNRGRPRPASSRSTAPRQPISRRRRTRTTRPCAARGSRSFENARRSDLGPSRAAWPHRSDGPDPPPLRPLQQCAPSASDGRSRCHPTRPRPALSGMPAA